MRRHAYDWVALAFGAFFLAGVANWAAHAQGLISTSDLALAAPVALIIAGLLGIVASLTKVGRNRRAPADTDQTDETQEIHREQEGSTS